MYVVSIGSQVLVKPSTSRAAPDSKPELLFWFVHTVITRTEVTAMCKWVWSQIPMVQF